MLVATNKVLAKFLAGADPEEGLKPSELRRLRKQIEKVQLWIHQDFKRRQKEKMIRVAKKLAEAEIVR